jgi:hypothetical protein
MSGNFFLVGEEVDFREVSSEGRRRTGLVDRGTGTVGYG